MRHQARLGVLLLAVLAITGCSADASTDGTTLTVLAAASLTDVSADLTAAYEQEHPDVRLRFSLAGSQELASQVRQGVPADVLVTADEPTMEALDSAVRDVVPVASNRLVIVVPTGNPRRVTGLDDLARTDVATVLAAPNVPAGRYARIVLDSAAVRVEPKSEETDVRAVLTRVRLGEADAGIVYVTDAAAAADDVDEVAIPERLNLTARYPAAVVADSDHPAQATAFVSWLAGPEGRRVLVGAGFLPP
jgi:molybdate transport system substrate-binding protein